MKRLYVLPLLLAACGGQQLAQGYEIDRLRILAVRAEPAEPGPGDVVTFEALVVHPDLAIESVVWFGCLAVDAGTYGCELDEDLFEEFEDLDPDNPPSDDELADLYERLVEAGLLGVEPGFAPTYTVPDDLLDTLTEEQRAEGMNLMLTVTATVAPTDRDFDDTLDAEIGFKRVPISLGETPNQNPDIASLSLDGQELLDDTVLEVERCACYDLEANLTAESIEDYVYVNSDQVSEDRTEEPYFTWYMTAGTPDIPFSLHPYGITWQASTSEDEVSLWVVVRDRRGGMGWREQRLTLREPARTLELDDEGEPICGICPA